MRVKCKCGVVLSDTLVPNNVVYWTYPVNEEDLLIKTFRGEYPDLTQIAIWHCEACSRFYYWSHDWKVYTYRLKQADMTEIKGFDWTNIKNVYISFNDFEEDEIMRQLKETGQIVFPRKIKIIETDKKIAVVSKCNMKLYELEDVIS
ncbi:hypothetical protein YSY43_39010 [Paenibacillus sp. YSY-4.3]